MAEKAATADDTSAKTEPKSTRELPSKNRRGAKERWDLNAKRVFVGLCILVGIVVVGSLGFGMYAGYSGGNVPGGDGFFHRLVSSPGSGGTVRGATYTPTTPLPSACTEQMKYAYAKNRRLQTFNAEGCSALTEIIKGSGTLEDMAGNVDERWRNGRLVYQSPTPYNVTNVRFASSDAVLQFKLCRDHIPARANPSWQCR